jgi:hypothetical protein
MEVSMPILRAGLRPAFAALVIAHGLAHSVLPLSGWMDPGQFGRDFMPLILYGTAVVGFTTAGIGLLGVTPFTHVVRPLLVVASAYSLVAISRAGQGDLWWGVALDVMLLVTGLSGIYRYLPAPRPHTRAAHRVGVAIAAAFLLYVAGAAMVWPFQDGRFTTHIPTWQAAINMMVEGLRS